PTGMAAPLTPKWSHDGRWIAFIRRDQGKNRLHIVSLRTLRSRTIFRDGADVAELEWDATSPALTISFLVHDSSAVRRYSEEGRSGYRYDSRFWMLGTTEPLEESPVEAQRFRLDLSHSSSWHNARLEHIGPRSASADQTIGNARIEADGVPA